MKVSKEGGSITCPLLLDRTNYPYWKAKMTAFLKSVNTKTWKPDKSCPLVTTWLSMPYSFVVDVEVFKIISSCKIDKEALEVLEIAYEGT
ncbi:hypothetical protein LIER_42122 [Lithospermum erythrorhizon]|uniref:Gag-pol polyprotein n=1 Tax=Lithospermum erythrorhizon TaxID=34254 RepID=A0AAV3RMT4_LITER